MCSCAFGTRTALEQHRLIHNDEAAGPVVNLHSHKCPQCDFRATRKGILAQHIRDTHRQLKKKRRRSQARPPECLICFDESCLVACLPCGHVCVCDHLACTTAVSRSKKCPQCHEKVEGLDRHPGAGSDAAVQARSSPTCDGTSSLAKSKSTMLVSALA